MVCIGIAIAAVVSSGGVFWGDVRFWAKRDKLYRPPIGQILTQENPLAAYLIAKAIQGASQFRNDTIL